MIAYCCLSTNDNNFFVIIILLLLLVLLFHHCVIIMLTTTTKLTVVKYITTRERSGVVETSPVKVSIGPSLNRHERIHSRTRTCALGRHLRRYK